MNASEYALLDGGERDASTIGIVEAVSPDRVSVAILNEAPHGTGLHEGAIHRFPRLNSYVVLPSERGSILALVTWLGIDEDRPRRPADDDRIGLPSPRRRLHALPLGVLRRHSTLLLSQHAPLTLDRGVLLFPTVGDPVRLPTAAELCAAVPTIEGDRPSVAVGRAPLAGNAAVRVDPDRLFGRHLAILGNTGSGKSCTVAQLMRGAATCTGAAPTSFRAIVLDPNGEYSNSFDHISGVTVRRLSAHADEDHHQLRVPAWVWDYREWLSFADASGKSQAPQLRRALHLLRTADLAAAPTGAVSVVGGRLLVTLFQIEAIEGTSVAPALSKLKNVRAACDELAKGRPPNEMVILSALSTKIGSVLASRWENGKGSWKFGAAAVDQLECASLAGLFDDAIEMIGIPELDTPATSADTPTPFDPADLIHLLPIVGAASGSDVVGWITPMIERLRISLADERLRRISGWRDDETIDSLLKDYFGAGNDSQIAVIDLSLVPTNVLHLVVAVLARVLLEALERHRRADRNQVPVILVVDEAHTLIRQRSGQATDDQTIPASRLCREAFERIAREGRKFGLSLVVSSQRPSELSETVLSQCNTFLVHRIVNGRDQDLVRRLLPDSLGGLTDELPALQSQFGLLVGWAIDVPTLIRVDDLEEAHRPRSSDPAYSDTWLGAVNSAADWPTVAAEWLGQHEVTSADSSGESDAPPTSTPSQTPEVAPDDEPF